MSFQHKHYIDSLLSRASNPSKSWPIERATMALKTRATKNSNFILMLAKSFKISSKQKSGWNTTDVGQLIGGPFYTNPLWFDDQRIFMRTHLFCFGQCCQSGCAPAALKSEGHLRDKVVAISFQRFLSAVWFILTFSLLSDWLQVAHRLSEHRLPRRLRTSLIGFSFGDNT